MAGGGSGRRVGVKARFLPAAVDFAVRPSLIANQVQCRHLDAGEGPRPSEK